MTTALLHTEVQRSRFARHVAEFFIGLITPVARHAPASAAVEAQRVRNLAAMYVNTHPGFAADLYAAAARHEA